MPLDSFLLPPESPILQRNLEEQCHGRFTSRPEKEKVEKWHMQMLAQLKRPSAEVAQELARQ